jgi:hypothetical protein
MARQVRPALVGLLARPALLQRLLAQLVLLELPGRPDQLGILETLARPVQLAFKGLLDQLVQPGLQGQLRL